MMIFYGHDDHGVLVFNFFLLRSCHLIFIFRSSLYIFRLLISCNFAFHIIDTNVLQISFTL